MMKIYTVHARSQDTPVFIPEGFSLWAFVFGGAWALYHRLWVRAALLLLVHGLIVMLAQREWVSPAGADIARLGVQVMVGFWANDWLREGLSRRGYTLVDIVSGPSRMLAQQRYFDRTLAGA